MMALAYIGPGAGFLVSGPGPYLLIGLGLLFAWLVVRGARGRGLVAFSDEQARRWERQRSHGLAAFVVVRGMLLFGITSAVVALALGWLWSPDRSFGDNVLRALITWPGAGILWAVLMWHINESAYAEWSRDHAG